MIKNYLKIAFRNILRNKLFSAINVIGLSISIAVSFCIVVYISYELSYDKHHENYDNIYRVDSKWEEGGCLFPQTSFPLGLAIKEEISGIDEVARCFYKKDLKCEFINSSYTFKNNYFVDPSIFNVFTYEFIEGNKDKVLDKPNSAVLSERTALTIFGRKDVVGEIISFQYNKSSFEVEVTGVIKDENNPATITPEVIFPLELLFDVNKNYEKDDWVQAQRALTFLLISNEFDINLMEKKIRQVNDQHTENLPFYAMNVDFLITPLNETYFINDKNYNFYFLPIIDINELIIYSSIAFLIVLLACINFILLTSAKSSNRYLEFGIRKVVGARKRDVVLQIIFEAVITLILTVPFTLIIIEIIFPYMQELVELNIYPSFYYNIGYILSLIILNIFIGIITGWYIALSLYKKQSADIFREKNNLTNSRFTTRRVLLLFQIVAFVGLLISALVIKKQINFLYNNDPGYDNSNVVTIRLWEIKGNEDAFRNSVVDYSGIKDYAFTLTTFPEYDRNNFSYSKSKNDEEKFKMVTPKVGKDYPRFLNLNLIAGAYPSKEKKKLTVVINETAARIFNFDDPIGDYVYWLGKYRREIVGVVKDFHVNNMKEKIKPVVMELSGWKSNLVIRIENGQEVETLKYLHSKWSEFSNSPMNYEFTNDRLNYFYTKENNFEKLIDLFTALAILISTMGLFGIVMFSTQQRTKEIGVRKVLGASILDILKLISNEFLHLVIIGSIVAFPISYYLIKEWLNNFAYKIGITADIFLFAFILALLITFITISTQVIKAARLNPVNSLRNE